MFRKGSNEVSTNGVTANVLSCFLTEGLVGTPVDLRLSSQKCQGVPVSPILHKTHEFAAAPFSVDPICPQPRHRAYTEYLKTTQIAFFKGFNLKRKSPQGDLKQETSQTSCPRHRARVLPGRRGVAVVRAPPSGLT